MQTFSVSVSKDKITKMSLTCSYETTDMRRIFYGLQTDKWDPIMSMRFTLIEVDNKGKKDFLLAFAKPYRVSEPRLLWNLVNQKVLGNDSDTMGTKEKKIVKKPASQAHLKDLEKHKRQPY